MVAKSEFYEIDTGVAEVLHEPDGSMVLLVNGVPSSHIVPGEPTGSCRTSATPVSIS